MEVLKMSSLNSNEVLHPPKPFGDIEREVAKAALTPHVWRTIPIPTYYEMADQIFYDDLADEPEREKVFSEVQYAVFTHRQTGCDTVHIYRTHGWKKCWEYFVTAERAAGAKAPQMWGFSENLHTPLQGRIFDVAWNTLRYRSIRDQMRAVSFLSCAGFAVLLVASGYMLFREQWAEKAVGVLLLVFLACTIVCLSVHDRRVHNRHISRVESYLRKLELLPRASGRRAR
jgi:hypothetical protein